MRLPKIIIVLVLGSSLVLACDPFVTRRINNISKRDERETIHVTYPIVETRRESNTSSFDDPDNYASKLTDSLVKKALLDVLGRKALHYADYERYEYSTTKKLLDSVLNKFAASDYDRFFVTQRIEFPIKGKLLVIPHFVWTRSTEDYDQGKCGKVGYRDYANNKYCTWTRSVCNILIINIETKEVIYFKHYRWEIANIHLPYQSRVNQSFKACARPLLRKLHD